MVLCLAPGYFTTSRPLSEVLSPRQWSCPREGRMEDPRMWLATRVTAEQINRQEDGNWNPELIKLVFNQCVSVVFPQ